jgi:hydrogenase/urease accessory protein HupE
MTRLSLFIRCALAFAVVFVPSAARAHHDPISSLTVTVERRTIRLVMVAPADELALWSPPAPADSPETYAAAVAKRLQDEAASLFELRADYNVLSPSNVRGSADDPQTVRLEVEYPPPDGDNLSTLQVFSNLVAKLSRNHQQVVCVQDHRTLASPGGAPRVVAWLTLTPQRITAFADLKSTATTAPATLPATAPSTAVPPDSGSAEQAEPVSFFHLGVEHILTGYDHLLFLAALLLVCATFREAAVVITCFTVAHSVTLALAALDVVRLPSRAVEAVIAASIVYVALENVFRFGKDRQRLAWRAGVTFAFGLVHGMGFASVLRELGLGSVPGGVVMPLLKFNLGVEAGQLAVAAVVFPLILVARRRVTDADRILIPALSACVAAAGGWWLLERVALT